MQNYDMIDKKRVYIDGVEVSGLVRVGERSFDDQVAEVPSFDQIREVKAGIYKNPRILLVYKIERNTDTSQVLENWFFEKEHHDVTIEDTDADGIQYHREKFTECEAIKLTKPDYDASSPKYAQRTIELVYVDRILLAVN